MSLQLKVKKLHPEAKLPTKNNITDAAFDFYAVESVNLYSGATVKIKTGVAIEIPEGYYGQLFDRSSVGGKGIKLLGGVIDGGYRGEIIVCLHNTNFLWERGEQGFINGMLDIDRYDIKAGDKIAQMVLLPVPQVEVVEVDTLGESDRGNKGFGSSGR